MLEGYSILSVSHSRIESMEEVRYIWSEVESRGTYCKVLYMHGWIKVD